MNKSDIQNHSEETLAPICGLRMSLETSTEIWTWRVNRIFKTCHIFQVEAQRLIAATDFGHVGLRPSNCRHNSEKKRPRRMCPPLALHAPLRPWLLTVNPFRRDILTANIYHKHSPTEKDRCCRPCDTAVSQYQVGSIRSCYKNRHFDARRQSTRRDIFMPDVSVIH